MGLVATFVFKAAQVSLARKPGRERLQPPLTKEAAIDDRGQHECAKRPDVLMIVVTFFVVVIRCCDS